LYKQEGFLYVGQHVPVLLEIQFGDISFYLKREKQKLLLSITGLKREKNKGMGGKEGRRHTRQQKKEDEWFFTY
jgi:hypothetical protein